jgi:hypothetical protein
MLKLATRTDETKRLAREAVRRYLTRKYKARLRLLQARAATIRGAAIDRAVERNEGAQEANR